MADFNIFESDQFRRKLKKLGGHPEKIIDKKLIEYIIPILKKSPRIGPNVKKLKGYSPDIWRYRFGDYRIFYQIITDKNEVWLITIDNRKDAYK